MSAKRYVFHPHADILVCDVCSNFEVGLLSDNDINHYVIIRKLLESNFHHTM
jgi:hypothetical protein